mgnify:FL=1
MLTVLCSEIRFFAKPQTVSGKLPGQITMRLINGIILLLTVSLTSYGQVTEKDSLISSRYSNELVKKCFDGLTKSSTLDTLEKKLGFHFCSIAACVNPFSIRYLKGQDSESVKLRLQEIAERLVKDGTPVILFGGEQSDLKDTDKLNTDHNGNNITYLATGNCCYRFYNEAYFEDAFNQRTKELLGIVKPKKKRKAASR